MLAGMHIMVSLPSREDWKDANSVEVCKDYSQVKGYLEGESLDTYRLMIFLTI